MLKQSICYPLFHDVSDSPAAFCKLVAEMGYQGIDLWDVGPLADLAEPAKAHGLTITGFIGHQSIESGLNDPTRHDDIVEALHHAIDRAAANDVPTLIAFAGNRLSGQSDADGIIQTARALRRVASHAEQQGVTICVELLNSSIDHPGYLADCTDHGLAICEMVNSPAVKLLFDIYHMQIMEGNVIARITQAIHRIGHIHTAGVPGRHDLDNEQELNYAGIARALSDAGYAGFVGHEFWAKGDKARAMQAALNVCREFTTTGSYANQI